MIDIDLTNYISSLEVDKTIAVFKGSLLIPAGGNNQVDHTLPVGAGHTFWEGTYTLDSQTQQNDIGGLQYSGLRGAGLEARSYVGGIRVRGVNTTGSSVTAHYNLSVIASPETGIIPAQGTFPSQDNPIAFDSRDDTRKIVLTRLFGTNMGDAYTVSTNFYVFRFQGDGEILSSSKRVKVYTIYDGIMYDLATTYANSGVVVTDVGVVASNGLYTNQPSLVGDTYIRFYYE